MLAPSQHQRVEAADYSQPDFISLENDIVFTCPAVQNEANTLMYGADTPVIRLIYSGSLRAARDTAQLAQFIEQSRETCRQHRFSGVTVLIGLDFLQIIEGPKQAMDDYQTQLLNQRRQAPMTLLARQEISEPLFADWSLGIIRADPQVSGEANEGETLLEIEQIDPKDPDARRTLRLIREFVDGKWHHHLPGGQPVLTLRQTRHG